VAASVAASLKGERDLAVGNAIGSCLFNILAVMGLAALVAPDGIAVAKSALHFDIPVMIAVASRASRSSSPAASSRGGKGCSSSGTTSHTPPSSCSTRQSTRPSSRSARSC
jgi:hypothetical protein